MAGKINFGLTSLMEAIKYSEKEEKSDETMEAMLEEAIDDDIINALEGDDDVEDDMDGEGIGEDDEEMERLLEKIPPSDKLDEENLKELEELSESALPVFNYAAGGYYPVTEGANWDSYKIYFSRLRRDTSKKCKAANKLAEAGDYEHAAKLYREVKDIFQDLKLRLNDVDDSFLSTIISYFMTFTFYIIPFIDAGTTKGGSSLNDLNDAGKELTTTNATKFYIGANINRMIAYCDQQIARCERLNKEKKSGKRPYKYDLN